MHSDLKQSIWPSLGYDSIAYIIGNSVMLMVLFVSIAAESVPLIIFSVILLIFSTSTYKRIAFFINKDYCRYFSVFTGFRKINTRKIDNITYGRDARSFIGSIKLHVPDNRKSYHVILKLGSYERIANFLNFMRKVSSDTGIDEDSFKSIGIILHNSRFVHIEV